VVRRRTNYHSSFERFATLLRGEKESVEKGRDPSKPVMARLVRKSVMRNKRRIAEKQTDIPQEKDDADTPF